VTIIDKVPVIDVSTLDDKALAAIDAACREWGFFQVVGHGFAAAHLAQVQEAAAQFFHQPTQAKRALSRTADNPWGFFDQELTKNRRDWKEILDIGPDSGGEFDPFPAAQLQWPAVPTNFEAIMRHHFVLCEQLSYALLSALARNLGVANHALDSTFSDAHASFLRLNYYPVCADPAPADAEFVPQTGELGISHHTDAGALTVLWQDQIASLQVHHDGVWHRVTPQSDALVINIGDVVQVWSNDRYRAPLHRVLAHADSQRFSAAFFFNPSYSASYAPLAGTGTARYRAISWREFRAGRAGGDYADSGEELQIADYRVGKVASTGECPT
jgi:isopenicillin N synthase-like dioxygenase